MRAREGMRSPSSPASYRAVANARYRLSDGRMQLMKTELGLFPYRSSLRGGAVSLRPLRGVTAGSQAMPRPSSSPLPEANSDHLTHSENFTNLAAHERMQGRETSQKQSIA